MLELKQSYVIESTDFFGQDFSIDLVEQDPERVGYITLHLDDKRLSLTIEEWEKIVTVVRGAQAPILAGRVTRGSEESGGRG